MARDIEPCDDEPTPCQACHYWRAHSRGESYGTCRRYPPKLFWDVVDESADAKFPETFMNDWCGEWTSKPPRK